MKWHAWAARDCKTSRTGVGVLVVLLGLAAPAGTRDAQAESAPAPSSRAVSGVAASNRCSALGTGPADQVATPLNGFVVKELTPDQQQELGRLDAEIAQDGAAARRARFLRARFFYTANHYREAARGFCELIELSPTAPESVQAVMLLWDTLNILQWQDELRVSATRYCAWPSLTRDASLKELCGKLVGAIQRLHAEQVQKEGRYLEAGHEYLTLAGQKSYRLADEAYFNAAVCFDKAGDGAAAAAAREQLVKTYPQSPLAKKAAERLKASSNPGP